MKLFLISIALALLSFSAHADSLNCSGDHFFGANFINGNCNRGYCNGTIPADFFSTGGDCETGVTFNAQGYTSTNFINTTCNNGYFNFWIYSSRVRLSGTCSNGGHFEGEMQLPMESVNGSCRADGPLSAYQYARSVAFEGTCSTP